ncbi:hypothetical protein G5I_07155 [Acromyrmex echinatior]|uniref:Uncharacterized protein n=1 Tax=Acromyrmex echinatior TaxID=103372 RepID=F4WN16_ACREC|nr:hypothetical protein G5I_07155 [Acromyrmex echinatior]
MKRISPSLGVHRCIVGSRLSLYPQSKRDKGLGSTLPLSVSNSQKAPLEMGKVFFASAGCSRPPVALTHTFRCVIGTFKIRDVRFALPRRDYIDVYPRRVTALRQQDVPALGFAHSKYQIHFQHLYKSAPRMRVRREDGTKMVQQKQFGCSP